MALYLGNSEKLIINISGQEYVVHIPYNTNIKTWIYPYYDTDGILVIPQVYSATLTDGVLEVS